MINKKLAFLLIFFLVIKTFQLVKRSDEFVIKVFDVGQGDAILIKTPHNFKMLIDGGADYEADRYLGKEFFLNFCTVDLLILTHPHQDHIKGLNRVFERCSVGGVVFDPVRYKLYEYDKWLRNVKTAGFDVKHAVAGDVFDLGKGEGGVPIRFIVVWPDKSGYYNHNINNASVSGLLDYGEYEALFLGDLEKEASSKIDKALLSKYIDGQLEVYKVPHHGSSDSNNPELAEFLQPQICLVSVGEDNKFDHPGEQTMKDLQNIGCEVLRTDQEGTIEVLIN